MAQYYSPEPQQTSALKHWQVASVSFFARYESGRRPMTSFSTSASKSKGVYLPCGL